MVRWFYVFIYVTAIVVLTIGNCSLVSSAADQKTTCNRSIFLENVFQKGIRINNTIVEKLKQCKVDSCSTLKLRIAYASKGTDPTNQYAIVSPYGEVILGQTGCWGYYLEIRNSSKTIVQYFDKPSMKGRLFISKVSSVNVSYNMVTLPTMKSSTIETISADSCTLEGIRFFSKEIDNTFLKKCGTKGFLSLHNVSSIICEKYSASKPDQEWQLIYATVVEGCIVWLKNISRKTTQRDSTICDKDRFINAYVNTSTPINESIIYNLKKQCNENLLCYAAPMRAVLGKHQSTGDVMTWFTIVKDLNAIKNKDCWGFYIKVLYGENYEQEDIRYINFQNEKMATFQETFNATANRKYISYGIPSGARTEMRLTKIAGYCTIKTLAIMKEKMEKSGFKTKCSKNITDDGKSWHFLSDIADIICKKYPMTGNYEVEQMDNRKHDVETYFSLNQNTCQFSYSGIALAAHPNTTILIRPQQMLSVTTDRLNNTSRALITTFTALLVVPLLITGVAWLIYRHRKKKPTRLQGGNHENVVENGNNSKSIHQCSISSRLNNEHTNTTRAV